MTVKELIEKLKDEDPDRIVVLQKDAEGNGFSPLYSYWLGSYVAETTWYGEMWLEELTEEDIEVGFTEEDVKQGQKAVSLTPVN